MNTVESVALHNTPDDLYVIIDSVVFDLSKFLNSHPGGSRSILRLAGKDASKSFHMLHPPNTLSSLPIEYNLGPVVESVNLPEIPIQVAPLAVATVENQVGTVEEIAVIPESIGGMKLVDCLSLNDFEKAAEVGLNRKAWAWYSSAADDHLTLENNRNSYRHVSFRPRNLRNVEKINLSTSILGFNSSLPIFISPVAMGKLAHPEGEYNFARVAEKSNIPYIVSANASFSFSDIAASATKAHLMYQVSVNKNRSVTAKKLTEVKAAGYKAIVLNVGSPVSGKLERNERNAILEEDDLPTNISTSAPLSESIASLENAYLDASFEWSDLEWLRKCTNLPLVVKGITTVEDALLCVEYGVDVIYLSNHGGRQLEGSPSSLETLLEIRMHAPEVLASGIEIWMDGGVRRGADVLKALALGATAVGIGRGFMYSLMFGESGVQAVVNIMAKEISTGLRLLGVTDVKDLNPSMVNTRRLDTLVFLGPISKM